MDKAEVVWSVNLVRETHSMDTLEVVPEDLANAEKVLDFRFDMMPKVHVHVPIAFVNREARAVALAGV
ncbi:hypothetical protein ACQKWADRAFT_315593 [Trichoderma austrokoningii]